MKSTLLRVFKIHVFLSLLLALTFSNKQFNQIGQAAKPNCAALAFESVALPTGTVNQPYNAALESDGGSGSYQFSKLVGTLPNGVTLNPNGTFSGTPTQPGAFALTVQTQDANGCSGSQEFSLTVNCQTITVTAPANNSGFANASFSAQFTQSGGVGTTTFGTSNTLPTGITLAPSGTLSGTTAQTGSFPLVVTATDSNGCTGTVNYTLTINACPTSFTVSSLLDTSDAAPGNGVCADANGQCTLRAAIEEANAVTACSPLVIDFGVNGTINPATALPQLNHPNLSIVGPGAKLLTVARPGNAPNFGIFIINAGTRVSISGLTITGGAPSGDGGGIFNNGLLTLRECAIVGNAADHGGGLRNFFNGTATISECLFSNNRAFQTGAGIHSSGTLTLTNTTFSGNAANFGGGGINRFAGDATLTNCTFADNTAAFEGSHLRKEAGGTFSLRNTLVAHVTNAAPILFGAFTSQGNNFIGSSDGTNGFTNGINSDQVGTPASPLDPRLLPLADYGGQTQTRALPANSPAVNAGLSNGAPEIDQRGLLRNIGAVDIGAFESFLFNPAALPNASVGVGYNQFISTTGGTAPHALSLHSGALPAGVTVSGNSLTGTPTVTGTSNFTLKATDQNGFIGFAPYSLTVVCPTITLADLPGGTAGVPYQQTLSALPAGKYSFALTSGTLPNGLTLVNGLFSGTPTQTGVFNFRLTATGAGSCSGFRDYQLNIACPTVTLSSAPLARGNVGATYSQTLTTSPAGNYSFAVTAGTLPPGLTLNSNGLISGTPSQLGLFSFRVAATGFGGCSGVADYQINVSGCATISPAPATLPNGVVGTGYSQIVTAAGGATFSVTSGALPPGLMLNGSSGSLSGTPSMSGSFNFRITASLSGCTDFRDYTLNIVCPVITLNKGLLIGKAGENYNQSITVTPAGTYTFSLSAGNLPSGLTLNPNTGQLSGIVTTAGAFIFTVKALTAGGCAGTQSYTLAIACPTIALSALATPVLGTFYNQTVSATPAGGNYSFTVSEGTLPSGLILNPATGVISGTPTASGTFNFTIATTGFGICPGSRTYSFTLGGSCPTITLPDLPGGQPGQLYNTAITASPAGSYSYAVTSGSLPPGLTLFGGFGLLYGFPNTAGTFNFTITATDANNCTGSKSYSLVIGGAATRSLVFGDFDGDGKADLSVWRGASGEWLTVNSSDAKMKTEAWGSSAAPYFDVMTPGDYDGDGKMDLAVFRRGTGDWFIKRSSDGAVTTKLWGLGTDTPVPGDYDGDGRTDIAVWRGADTTWYIVRSSDGQTQTVSWGTSRAPYFDVPVPADYDGDGKTDIAVFRQANGHWYIRLSAGNEIVDKAWGLGSDVPVAADFDGDGRADIAVWRGAEMNWYVLRSSDGKVQTISLSAVGSDETPVAGDFDGDGKADVALWREKDGRWTIESSRDNSVRVRIHGQTGDHPVAIGR
ncbi:MAG TPA: putative Ig domain-containing protein [Blastocatellia bacterium]|nr:putative Ig domain-containing protein [Blastocatellia bacterium]